MHSLNWTIRILSYVLNERKKDLKKSTVKRMLTRNFPVDEVRGIIQETLEIMFDAEDPEALDRWQRDTALEQVERDDIQSSMSIACFSVDDYKDTIKRLFCYEQQLWSLSVSFLSHRCISLFVLHEAIHRQ